jgi:hypothetical protein
LVAGTTSCRFPSSTHPTSTIPCPFLASSRAGDVMLLQVHPYHPWLASIGFDPVTATLNAPPPAPSITHHHQAQQLAFPLMGWSSSPGTGCLHTSLLLSPRRNLVLSGAPGAWCLGPGGSRALDSYTLKTHEMCRDDQPAFFLTQSPQSRPSLTCSHEPQIPTGAQSVLFCTRVFQPVLHIPKANRVSNSAASLSIPVRVDH